ncbi:MAG: ATP-dependent nuclease [Gemmataceae bacterium]
MKLQSAQVTNFRCIEDSTEFTLDQITCLVGKNEAGKTALLKAFYGLKPWDSATTQPFDRDLDYPRRHLMDYDERHQDAPAVVISTKWKLDAADKAALEAVLGSPAKVIDTVAVSRGYEGPRRWEFTVVEAAVIQHLLDSAGLHAEEINELKAHATTGALRTAVTALQSPSERHASLRETLNSHFTGVDAHSAAVAILEQLLPSFVYVAQYDKMQGQVSLEEIIKKKNENPGSLNRDDRVFLAFCDLVGMPVEEIAKIKKFEMMSARFGSASIKITDEMFTYWTQNRHLKVIFRLDSGKPEDTAPFNAGNVLRTRIFNTHHQMEIGFDDRSTGFVWFFSFLVLFSQVKKVHGSNVVILLDEPALSLHAKAQSDLLRYVKERLAPGYQVIYTTHSPFLVPADNILSVRTVEDVVIERPGERIQVLGTKVGDRVLSRDRDTLFPLQGALGYELTQTLFVGKHTLLVEGPSDLLYIKIASDELKRRNRTALDPRWVISPTGGASKVSAFITLFGANDLNIATLLDYAKGDKKAIQDLRNSELLKSGRVLTYDHYAKQPEADVEDIIGARNYVELVNWTYALAGKDVMRVPASVPVRILKEAEVHFRTVSPSVPEFDHYTPSRHFCENQTAIMAALPEAEAMLDRFEAIFKDLNPMITP